MTTLILVLVDTEGRTLHKRLKLVSILFIGGHKHLCNFRLLCQSFRFCNMASAQRTKYNAVMKIPGKIRDGKVELDGVMQLPEGASVLVEIFEPDVPTRCSAVKFPLVKSRHPGSLKLSNQRIVELLEDEDLSSGR